LRALFRHKKAQATPKKLERLGDFAPKKRAHSLDFVQPPIRHFSSAKSAQAKIRLIRAGSKTYF
jgi:hypothetical protein